MPMGVKNSGLFNYYRSPEMKNLTIYDPPLCCSTGVCGPSIDPNLVRFASDLEWLKTQGVAVRRYNLAQEPERFVENGAVKAVLDRSGGDELPAILAGETLVSSGRFPSRDELSAMAGLAVTDTGDGSRVDAPKAASDGCGCNANDAACG